MFFGRANNSKNRLHTAPPQYVAYQPKFSVAFDGNSISFYQHEQRKSYPPFLQMATLVPAWLIFWTWVWTMVLIRLPFRLLRRSGPAQNPIRE